jgi:hypothetical protein
MLHTPNLSDYRHLTMSPEAVHSSHRMQESEESRIGLRVLSQWLIEATGESYHVLYPVRNCGPDDRKWNSKPSGHSFRQFGIYALTDQQVEIIADSSSNRTTPEPVTVIYNERINQVIGFDVWGMGQHVAAKLEKGDSPSYMFPTLPDDHWAIKYVYLH